MSAYETSEVLSAIWQDFTPLLIDALEAGCAVNAIDDEGMTLLMLAISRGRSEMVKILVDKGADVDYPTHGITPLILAAEVGAIESVEILITSKANVDLKTPEGLSALMAASIQGHIEIVKLLLAHGADINTVTNQGGTALDAAKSANQREVVELLERQLGIGTYPISQELIARMMVVSTSSDAASSQNKPKSSKFVRHIEPQILASLKESDLFKNHLLPDIQKGRVFPAFRNNRVDFYYAGGKLFSYSNKGFVTHIKYASVLIGKQTYIGEGEIQKPQHIQSFAEGYKRIKENCKRYSAAEASGVSAVCAAFKSVFEDQLGTILPLDIEISFSTEDDSPMDEQNQIGTRKDRIDLLVFNTQTQRLRFYEAKHYSNSELWPRGTKPPEVIEQLGRYEKLVSANEQNIVRQYENYMDLLAALFEVRLPKPLGIDETSVVLLAFGYDQQQESKMKTLLKDNMQGHPYYSCGTASPDRLNSMWKQVEK